MRTHPPIFNRLTSRLDARHPANVLARRLAHREGELIERINQITRRLNYQRAPRFNNYRPEGDCS